MWRVIMRAMSQHRGGWAVGRGSWRVLAFAALAGLILAPAQAAAQARDSAEASAAARRDARWKPPVTSWGHPDLEGIWTTDDMRGVPMSRQPQFGTRQYLTDEEFAARAKARQTAQDVDDARTGLFRNEEGTRAFGYTSMVIDPPDGRMPAVTPAAQKRRTLPGTNGVGPFNAITDFNLYDRCVTRGLLGSVLPVVYGNGARIVQTPSSVVIAYEMVHDTRVIPLDTPGAARPRLAPGIRQIMGDARGRWEGNTLVVETANFTDRTAIGANGNGIRHSEQLKLTERFTRVDKEMIDYEVRVEDPQTYVQPFTLRMTLTTQPDYEIYEYACHEGNLSLKHALMGEREYERQAAENAKQGLPPPERVFERVNGADRGR
jgi:hypothetical protein